jgi:hypothetical protein
MNTTYKDQRDTRKTDAWFAANGISTKAIYIGTAEVFQAQKLATNTLRNINGVLGPNEAHTLHNFLRATSTPQKCEKITQAQCYKVMNIAKQAQRMYSKLTKSRTSLIHK